MLKKVLFTALTCAAMVFAAGDTVQQEQGGAAGQQETMSTQGTIQDINVQDGFFTLETQQGTDTIYFDEQQLNVSMDELSQMKGQDVEVQYTTQDGKKMATTIAPAGQDGAAGESKGNREKSKEQSR
ncbi:MAG: hypothetical protein Q4F84_03370 [Fibrobacter sp.]|nr:hypothetical protein [Fibrobacter sp.]